MSNVMNVPEIHGKIEHPLIIGIQPMEITEKCQVQCGFIGRWFCLPVLPMPALQ